MSPNSSNAPYPPAFLSSAALWPRESYSACCFSSAAGTNLTRIGVLVLATFAISNPLLHFAKICNQLSLGPLKIGGFVLFAVAFFLSRVLLVPWAVLKPAMLDSR